MDAKRAEIKGLKIGDAEDKVINFMDKLFYTALLAKQPNITEKEAEDILNKFIKDGGDIQEISKFLSEQLTSFFKSPTGTSKKKVLIVEI